MCSIHVSAIGCSFVISLTLLWNIQYKLCYLFSVGCSVFFKILPELGGLKLRKLEIGLPTVYLGIGK